jgi:hypothetical protein
MAKKPSNPRRKPVPAKRRRRALPERREHVEAKGTFAGTAFQSDAFQTDVAKADRRAAPIAARTGEVASRRAQLTLTPKPVTVVPTPYPSDPAAPLPVHGYLRVDFEDMRQDRDHWRVHAGRLALADARARQPWWRRLAIGTGVNLQRKSQEQ